MNMLFKLLKPTDERTDTGFSASSVSLTVQLQTIQYLHVLLPEWISGIERQKEVLDQLIDMLADHALLTRPDSVLQAAHSQKRTSQGDSTGIWFTQSIRRLKSFHSV